MELSSDKMRKMSGLSEQWQGRPFITAISTRVESGEVYLVMDNLSKDGNTFIF